jgi:ribonuclease D
LKKLCAIILGFRISKRQQVTDWEAGELSEAQQLYAATDAWVCYEIFRKLSGEK